MTLNKTNDLIHNAINRKGKEKVILCELHSVTMENLLSIGIEMIPLAMVINEL